MNREVHVLRNLSAGEPELCEVKITEHRWKEVPWCSVMKAAQTPNSPANSLTQYRLTAYSDSQNHFSPWIVFNGCLIVGVYVYMHVRRIYMQMNKSYAPGLMAYTCNPSYLWVWGILQVWGPPSLQSKFMVSLSWLVKLYLKTKSENRPGDLAQW